MDIPVGFGGQWGYYTDINDPVSGAPANGGLILLGARYYDPYTARFLTRDPIGYEGGLNVYAYIGNNPVNGIDPSGLCPPNAVEANLLKKLQAYRGTTDDPIAAIDATSAVNSITAELGKVNTPTLPANLAAVFWSLRVLGNGDYSFGGSLSGMGLVGDAPAMSDKCNYFVAYAYAIGAGVGVGGKNGWPATKGHVHKFPAPAEWLGNPGQALNHLPFADGSMRYIPGDVVSWWNGQTIHHNALYIGGDLYANAFGPDGAVIRHGEFIHANQRGILKDKGGPPIAITRRYWK